MTAYMVVNLTFHDLGWAKDYMTHVPAMVREHGGEYLVRSKGVERLEGDGPVPDQVVILTFPSLEAIHAFMARSDYAPFRTARIAATDSGILVFED